VAISHTSIVVPFVLGAGLALWLFTGYGSPGVSFTSFALFMGVALGITAFPVLARILTDRGLEKTELGVLALGCAAADDATAWCLLAFVVGVTQAQVTAPLVTCLLALAYLAVMFFAAGPLARKYLGGLSQERLTTGVVAWVLVALLASSLATEFIGVHAIFGAFVLGAVIPHDSAVARLFTHKLEDIVSILLLPVFFAYTGMRTQIALVSGPADWLVCLAIVAVATAGKVGGTFAAARLSGLTARDSAALGVLMNTRGLMGLIVLDVGLEMGVIAPTLFAMMVLMALATTMMTGPLLNLLGVTGDAARAGRT
jgi:Kef-type K+ transport system membrane component KefB